MSEATGDLGPKEKENAYKQAVVEDARRTVINNAERLGLGEVAALLRSQFDSSAPESNYSMAELDGRNFSGELFKIAQIIEEILVSIQQSLDGELQPGDKWVVWQGSFEASTRIMPDTLDTVYDLLGLKETREQQATTTSPDTDVTRRTVPTPWAGVQICEQSSPNLPGFGEISVVIIEQ